MPVCRWDRLSRLWERYIQSYRCLGLLHHRPEQPWPASARRQLLVELAYGVEDWITEAALYAQWSCCHNKRTIDPMTVAIPAAQTATPTSRLNHHGLDQTPQSLFPVRSCLMPYAARPAPATAMTRPIASASPGPACLVEIASLTVTPTDTFLPDNLGSLP